jgi:branched-chain amino acid transport system ATP-binding protein
MLELKGVTVAYRAFLAVDGVDLSIEKGEIVGLLGANGGGKSSLARVIAGLVRPKAGSTVFCGTDLGDVPPQDRLRMGISLVPEGRGLFPHMSVEENLAMGAYTLTDARRAKSNADRFYELFPILKERRTQYAGTLSGGQQQMLAISVGLMSDPKLLIVDEPSLGLAPIAVGAIAEAFRQLRETGVTVLLVEQNAKLTFGAASRIYVMQTGRIRYHDTPENLLAKDEVKESFLSI